MTTILTDKSEPAAAVPVLALRPREAAAAIGVCERVLWEMTKADEVPHVRLGRTGKTVVYPVAELRAWLSRKAAEPQVKRDRPPEGGHYADSNGTRGER